MNKQTQFQKGIFFIYIVNFLFGCLIISVVNLMEKIIFEGLYHKIIVLGLINIPIGIIISIFIVSLTTMFSIFLVKLDYLIYIHGLDYIFENKNGEK